MTRSSTSLLKLKCNLKVGRPYNADYNLNSWVGWSICSAIFAFQTVAIRSVLS